MLEIEYFVELNREIFIFLQNEFFRVFFLIVFQTSEEKNKPAKKHMDRSEGVKEK